MPIDAASRDAILAAWRTNARVTAFLVEHLPAPLWTAAIPGAPQRTIRMIVAHMHNARCTWTSTLGKEHGVSVPPGVDRRTVTRRQLLPALRRSSDGIHGLLALGCDRAGQLPPSAAYVWRNLPLEVGHVLSYFVAHEGHHRGQIVLVARQLGHRLPSTVTNGLWQWSQRAKEAGRG